MIGNVLFHGLVFLSGCAALSWEVIWQLRTSLALGASAWGTSVTLAVTMGGMSAGAFLMGRFLRGRPEVRPVRMYGGLQGAIGAFGLLLGPAFRVIEAWDTRIYGFGSPAVATGVFLLGVAGTLGAPALCMGATLPVIGMAARQHHASLARLYGFNTLGAAGGALLSAFFLIPLLGVARASFAVAAVNLAVGAVAFLGGGRPARCLPPAEGDGGRTQGLHPRRCLLAVVASGFAMFTLEVAWFRALTAAFKGTSDAFAVMLACVLLALGISASLVPRLKRAGVSLYAPMILAAVLVLMFTPLIERIDGFSAAHGASPLLLMARWFGLALLGIGTPVLFLGVILPWILDEQTTPRRWGVLYGANTAAAVVGALCAGWFFLPALGVARTAWLAGIVLAAAALPLAPARRRTAAVMLAIAALGFAMAFESGLGRTRVQTGIRRGPYRPVRILHAFDGPDATYAAVETAGGYRVLLINGFITSVQDDDPEPDRDLTSYMRWMGHLPMVLHPDPHHALVICFGIGLTANAVRREGPQSLDIVDLSRRVFDMADLFPANEGVLDDPIVRAVVMDGRAFVRRTRRVYDVITLEPMPPNFAGMNALYSREFYEAARRRLGPDGVVAQWLPLHLVPVEYSVSIARTFLDVWPNAMLWVDPLSGTGILLGSMNEDEPLGRLMPGFSRPGIVRDLTESEVRGAFALDPAELARYAAPGEVITDDNQLLAYGRAVYRSHHGIHRLFRENVDRLETVSGRSTVPSLNRR